jgi:hypothetical protein
LATPAAPTAGPALQEHVDAQADAADIASAQAAAQGRDVPDARGNLAEASAYFGLQDRL